MIENSEFCGFFPWDGEVPGFLHAVEDNAKKSILECVGETNRLKVAILVWKFTLKNINGTTRIHYHVVHVPKCDKKKYDEILKERIEQDQGSMYIYPDPDTDPEKRINLGRLPPNLTVSELGCQRKELRPVQKNPRKIYHNSAESKCPCHPDVQRHISSQSLREYRDQEFFEADEGESRIRTIRYKTLPSGTDPSKIPCDGSMESLRGQTKYCVACGMNTVDTTHNAECPTHKNKVRRVTMTARERDEADEADKADKADEADEADEADDAKGVALSPARSDDPCWIELLGGAQDMSPRSSLNPADEEIFDEIWFER